MPVIKKLRDFFYLLLHTNFSFSKRMFFFLWFAVSIKGVPALFVCSFLVRQFSRMDFRSFLIFFFIVNIFLYEELEDSEDEIQDVALIGLTGRHALFNFNPSAFWCSVKHFCFYNFFKVKNLIKSSFFFFNKNSKKEFNGEKLNTFLLKKKKKEVFLKKYYKN